jgi:hypothetical protein
MPPLQHTSDTHSIMLSSKFENYIIAATRMLMQIDEPEKKLKNVFPLRRSFIPHYVIFETSAIAELFLTKHEFMKKMQTLWEAYNPNGIFPTKGGKRETFKVSEYGYYTWKTLFDLDLKIFGFDYKITENQITTTKKRECKYQFAFNLATDGVSVSLQMIKKDDIEKSEKQKKEKVEARKKDTNTRKQISEDELILYNQEKQKKKLNEAKKGAQKDDMLKKEKEKQKREKKKKLNKLKKEEEEWQKYKIEKIEYSKKELELL